MLSGQDDAWEAEPRSVDAWEAEPRSVAELREAAAHFERAAALCLAPALQAEYAEHAAGCRCQAHAS